MMLEWNQEVHEGRKTFFVDVILPLAIVKTYTYRVPFELNNQVATGKRVVVQFGKSKIYTAIVYHITQTAPSGYEAKYLLDVLDDEPVVTPKQLQLWEWMAAYYLCTIGEVMQAALPAALKLASETTVILNRGQGSQTHELNEKEAMILEALELKPELRVSEIIKLLGQRTVFPILKSLLGKGIIYISEEVVEKYKPRIKKIIRLNPAYEEAASRKALFEVLEKAPKQLDALLAFLKLEKEEKQITKGALQEASGASPAAIKALLEKEIFTEESLEVSRLAGPEEYELLPGFELSPAQADVLTSINQQLQQKDVLLLHGITSSGKTLIYIRLIEEVLEQGGQVFYLLPEIALTSQIIERLRRYFGNQIGVYHSRFSDNERAELWQKLLSNEYRIVLGARSAIFLPFSNLKLILVDEEHEVSYKQFDPAPRYHARDTAIYLASLHGAKVILGSATPSLESYYNAKIKKYGFAQLAERFGGVKLPEIEVVSIAEETKRKTMQSHFTSVLVAAIGEALSRREQVILFQNRRGHTPFSICATCGFSPRCINCDVSLTYHKTTDRLHCHYCGYRQDVLNSCPACGSAKIEQKGFGTEKIEDELKILFPQARVARMDFDSTRTRNSFQQLINDFEDGLTNIMVGTQMVAKGLDFSHVTLIGIISADSLLNYPDFRAFERCFQLLSQVAGRAGRRDKQGKVIIQAYATEHRIIKQVTAHDYQALFETETAERQKFQYPPLYRLIQINIKHKGLPEVDAVAFAFSKALRQQFGQRVLGPEAPLIGRIRNYYIRQILLKVEKEGVSVQKIKSVLKETIRSFESLPIAKGSLIQVNVDPY